MSLLVVILAFACFYLYWRNRSVVRIIRQLREAAEQSEPLLLEESNSTIKASGMRDLVKAFNTLIEEKVSISGTGKEYNQQIQTLLGNLREAVVMVGKDNRILTANTAFQKLISSPEIPVGQRLDVLIQGSAMLEFMNEIRDSGESAHMKFEAQINNVPFWLEASAAQLSEKDDGKGDAYTLFVLNDISREKRLELMRTEFVANLSHELRTPVTIIKGFAQTLIEDDTELEQQERLRFLDKIMVNSDRLHSLLQDLLLLSRLESTESLLQHETVHVQEFLKNFVDNLSANPDLKGKEILLELDPDVTEVEADPLRITQVMTNLVENAHKHARGSTEIKITTRADDEHMVLSVTDDGEGIPEKDLPHIFQRFYRVDKGRSRESGGTGLGLSIVKHIIVQHGGTINAGSKQGQGTTIAIRLPFSRHTQL
ncbi:MAG: sensor histidine kinase [Puniceicoccaceae bacterium]